MEFNYEKSLKRLEEIVAIIEEGDQSLEKTLELFFFFFALLNSCSKYLDSAEQKITKLLANGDANE